MSLPFLAKRQARKKPEERVGPVAGGVPDLRDLAAPDGLVEERDHLQVGSRYCRVYAVTGYPAWVRLGLLDALFAAGEVDASYHLYPVPDGDAVRELTARITQIGAQLELDERRGAHANLSPLRASYQSAWNLRERVQLGQDRMFAVTVAFAVWAKDRGELDARCRTAEEMLAGRAIHSRKMLLRQSDGLATVMPLGDNRLADIYRNFDCGAATALCPWVSADLAHPEGICLGRNLITGAPVFFDPHAGPPVLTNPHVGVFATAGAGKTFLVNVLCGRSAVFGRPTVFIDPEGGYNRLVSALGGTVVRISPGRPVGVNPLELEEDEREKRVPIEAKVMDVKWLVSAMVEREGEKLTLEEQVLLEQAVREEYASRGITEDPKSLWDRSVVVSGEAVSFEPRKKEMPTLSDLARRLEVLAPRVATLMKPMLKGGTLGIFDCRTEVELTKPLVVFDVSDLDERFLRPLAMQVLLGWVWEKFVKRDPKVKKQVVVDEAWMFLRQRDTADFLEEMARRARKRGCALIVVSQSFREFAESAQGRAVLANTDSVVLMQQAPAELDQVAEFFRLPQGQKDFLRQAQVGQALLRAGKQAVVLQVEASPLELEILTGEKGGR
jgi:type IV secretory pathway VirB4 component